MSLETAMVKHLEAHAGLSALVGTRIYPGANTSKKPVCPYIVYHLISGARQYTCGGDNTPVWATPRYQFDCCDTGRDGAKAVGDQLLACLGNRGQTVLGTEEDAYTIESSMAVGDVGPVYEPGDKDPSQGLWKRMVDIRIEHNE